MKKKGRFFWQRKVFPRRNNNFSKQKQIICDERWRERETHTHTDKEH